MHLQTWGTYYFSSGSSSWNGWYDGNGRVKVYLESQSQANNSSYIKIEHYIVLKTSESDGGMEAYSINSSYRANQGSQGGSYQSVTGSKATPLRPTYGQEYEYYLGSTYHTVYHNADGTGRLYVNGSIKATLRERNEMHSYTATRSSSFNVALPTIPRYANITGYSVWNNGLTEIGVWWQADKGIDYVQYSLNGGGWVDTANNTFYIGGLSPGAQYSVKIRVKAADSQLWTESQIQYATTTQVNYITSGNPNGNCDNELKITANNPSGARCDIKLEFPDIGNYQVLRHNETINTTFSASEMLSLASLIPNSNTTKLRATIITVINGVDTFFNYLDGTYSIVNGNPTFSNFTYKDVNTATINLTGSNQSIIKGYNILKAIILASNKAIANKGANMSKYRLVIGTKQIDANYSSTQSVEISLTNVDNNIFIIYAIDSRGNSTLKQISPSIFIEYFKPYFSSPIPTASRHNSIETASSIQFAGSFLNKNFGSKNNTLTVTYKFKKTSSAEYTNGTTVINPTISGNNFSFNGNIAGDLGAAGFDFNYSYNIKITVSDKLDSVSYDLILGTGKPNLAIHRNGIAINSPYDESIGGSLQIDGKAALDYEVIDTW